MSNYLKIFIKDKNVASVTPTSERVVKSVCEPINFSKDLVIVEYGPGNGVFTRYLLNNMTSGSRIILIETNEDFVSTLKKIKDKRVSVFLNSAENVTEILEKSGIEKADYIISGIPFSFLKEEVKDMILSESRKMLNDDGLFLAYQTTSHLEEPLKKQFAEVTTNFKIMNIPPMCVYKAHGAKTGR
ncbi:MAG: rRNA adenine N-6-methyltransferase family protein [Balneolales bacterium]